jgi:O-antigen/teichoic acid export membrane protein
VLSVGVFRVAVPRFIMDDGDHRERVLRTSIGLFLIYFALVGGGLLFLPGALLSAMGLGGFDLPFRIYAIAFVLRAFVVMELEILRMDHRPRLQSAVEALPSLLNLAALATLLPLMNYKVLASAWAMLAGWGAPFIFFFGRALWRRRPSLEAASDLLRYSAPMTIHRALQDINNLASRWVVLLSLGLGAAGVFTFFMRVGDLLKLAQMPLIKAWTPTMISASRNQDHGRADRAAILFMVIGTALFVASLLGCRLAAQIIDDHGKFSASYASIPIVVFAAWILTFYQVFGIGFFINKRPGAIAPITGLTAVTNIALSMVLVRTAGVYAVPYASVVSNLIFAGLSAAVGSRMFKFRSPRVVQVALVCMAVGVVAFCVDRIFFR